MGKKGKGVWGANLVSETDSEAALSRAGGWREKHSETNTQKKKKRETNDTKTHNTTEDHTKMRLRCLILDLKGHVWSISEGDLATFTFYSWCLYIFKVISVFLD